MNLEKMYEARVGSFLLLNDHTFEWFIVFCVTCRCWSGKQLDFL